LYISFSRGRDDFRIFGTPSDVFLYASSIIIPVCNKNINKIGPMLKMAEIVA
jgi:hypothetical protein